MLDRLLAGHRDLERIAERLRALLGAHVPDLDTLKAVRWEFATRLMQHLALEDRHLYANLAASADPRIAEIGRRYQREYAEHLASYAEHARFWTNDRVAAEWTRYRIATREQLRLLQMRIDLMERDLYPLADTAVSIETAREPSRSWAREAFDLKASIAPRSAA